MDAGRFDAVARALSLSPCRRNLLGLSLGGVLSVLGLGDTEGKNKKRKRRKKRRKKQRKNQNKQKIEFNEFGCVDVGKFCESGGQCCSGVCTGAEGNRTCQAHDTGGCTPDQDACTVETNVDCLTATGNDGACFKTTGNAGYCSLGGFCFACSRDVDCQPFCGPLAACAVCLSDCEAEGNTVCVGPDECAPPPD